MIANATNDPHPPGLGGTVDLDAVAADLQVSRWTVTDMARSGALPAFKVGRQWRIGVDAYAAWKAEQAARAERRARRYLRGL